MKKLVITLSIILISSLIFTEKTSAHPGRTDSNGGHTCRTNCAKWGLKTGEYHYHNGGGSSTNSANKTTRNVNTSQPKPKPTYTQADVDEGKSKGKARGYDDGYSRNTKNSAADTGNEGYKKGYAAGYEAGYKEGIEKIKQEDSEAGTSSGLIDGKNAFLKGENQEVSNNTAKSADWNSAYKIAFDKSYKQEKILLHSEQVGFKLGYSLADLDIPSEFTKEEAVRKNFEKHYKTAYDKRIAEVNLKHGKLGIKDGYALNSLSINSIDSRFTDSYKKGYEEGKSKRKEEVMLEGYNLAFIQLKYQESYKNDNDQLREWHKEGFDSNLVASEIKDTAFDHGYENSTYMISDEFTVNEEAVALYDSLFYEGQELKSQEKQQKIKTVAGVALPVGGLAAGGFFLRQRRVKKG
ncbi:YHYH domain-containing protein [Sporosarcina cascadiensis]|uniref:YHYH domain-containing protein n=1 Tax=Sporosarcina cascadiensis TaxID=2660747 RepID=UPI00129AC7D9|nr:YHYH domain-containing protein [Sporosarcina cascadiensis]